MENSNERVGATACIWCGGIMGADRSHDCGLHTELLEYQKNELLDLMGEISEEHWCAGWMSGLEYALWKIWEKEDKTYGMFEVSDENVELLKSLNQKTNGWWIRDEETEEKFISTEEMEKLYLLKYPEK